MLQFTDLNLFHHSIDIEKVTNVVVRPQNSDFLAAFHFAGSHVATATVNNETAQFIKFELANHGVTNHES